jgi:hypothetical protein
VSKNFIFIEDQFPTNSRRCEIIERKEIHLSPIENALSAIINKNLELKEKIEQVQNAPPGKVFKYHTFTTLHHYYITNFTNI